MQIAALLIALAPCGPGGAETLAQTHQVRVYDGSGTVRFCRRDQRGSTEIGSRGAVLQVRAAGDAAAWLIRGGDEITVGATDWVYARGRDIGPRFLSLAGSTIAWRRGPVTEIAALSDSTAPSGRLAGRFRVRVDRRGLPRLFAGRRFLGEPSPPCISSSGCRGVDGVAAAGRYVAVRSREADAHGWRSWVTVHGDRTRRPCRAPRGEIRAFVLTRDGALACAVERSDGVGEIRAEGERLDRGGGVDPDSLRRDGDRLVWTRDGLRQSAPLPHNPERLVRIDDLAAVAADGGRWVAFRRPGARATLVRDEVTGAERSIADAADGCYDPLIGGDLLVHSCVGPMLQETRLYELPSGRRLPIVGALENMRLRGVGTRWLEVEGFGYERGGWEVLLEWRTGRTIEHPSRDFARRVVDLDAASGYERICPPLRRQRDPWGASEDDFYDLDPSFYPLPYERPYALGRDRRERLVLQRCGTRRSRVLCAVCGSERLAGGMAIWRTQRRVIARNMRTGRRRTWPLPGRCRSVTHSSLHVYLTCGRATYRGRLPGR